MDEGFNWFLIIVVVVVAAVVFFCNGYIIICLQHPDDKNQAWLPKIVVWLGLNLAALSILMFPLDVANRGACAEDIPLSSCDLTMPMRELWYAVYILNAVLVFLVIPFAIFYYEAGSDKSMGGKIFRALIWVIATAVVIGLVLGIAYGLAGYVEYPTERLQSGLIGMDEFFEFELNRCPSINSTTSTVDLSGNQCDAATGKVETQNWEIRTTFPLYVVALSSAIGWVTFLVFGGVGLSALPFDLICSFFTRPTATITRSEYEYQARFLVEHAREIKALGEELKNEEREHGRTRRWKRNFKELNKQLVILEEMNRELEAKFPQGDDGETKWVLFQLSFFFYLILGLIGAAVSVLWLVHIVLYQLIDPPKSSLLNQVFVDLDDFFPLFGTLAFAFFCSYLLACTIKGHMKLGMSVGILDLYPIHAGATLMNSLLFNTALILLSSTAVLQFCADAFAVYAKDTDIQEIFGNDIDHLRGIKYLYNKDIFLYCLFGSTVFGIGILIVSGPKGYKRVAREDAYATR